jgi:hypothetical protein
MRFQYETNRAAPGQPDRSGRTVPGTGGPVGVDTPKFDERACRAIMAAHVSRTDEKGPGAWPVEAGLGSDPGVLTGAGPVSSVGRLAARSQPPGECSFVYDEAERTRLMADIIRLLREPAVPRTARLAGLTLIGWLARRRPDESPHAIGIDEARESERRIKSGRSKAR